MICCFATILYVFVCILYVFCMYLLYIVYVFCMNFVCPGEFLWNFPEYFIGSNRVHSPRPRPSCSPGNHSPPRATGGGRNVVLQHTSELGGPIRRNFAEIFTRGQPIVGKIHIDIFPRSMVFHRGDMSLLRRIIFESDVGTEK